MSDTKSRFSFGDVEYPHVVGDSECGECWRDYPKPCPCGRGLIHAQFGDENSDGDYWLFTKCDRCGEQE